MAVKTIQADPILAPIRFRRRGDRVLVTNDYGRFILLDTADFLQMVEGKIQPDNPLYKELEEKLMLRSPDFLNRAVGIQRARNDFLNGGPNLHIMILTLRCNYNCRYCHASRVAMSRDGYDMSPETARQVVDRIFETTSEAINIEFQGGEPLANWEVLRETIEYAEKKNREYDKDLAFTLVSNLSLMDDEKLAYLVDRNIYVCTSVDGPKELHDKNRAFTGGSSYDETVRWIERFHEEYDKRGFDQTVFHVDALMTTTRQSLPLWKEIIDEYVKLGLMSVHLRPLNPFGFVKKTWDEIGYSADEFMDFYEKSLDYILDLNRQGQQMIERMAAIYLTRILSDRDPNYMELRSPCGAAVGQVAYNYDGKVFTCDEGRMVSRMGDDIFRIGDIKENTLSEMIDSEEVKSLLAASIQDALPLCSDCAYKPYCGVCPIYNFSTQGDIVGQMPTNGRCQMAMASFDLLFDRLAQNDPELQQIFDRWITQKARSLDACTPYGT